MKFSEIPQRKQFSIKIQGKGISVLNDDWSRIKKKLPKEIHETIS